MIILYFSFAWKMDKWNRFWVSTQQSQNDIQNMLLKTSRNLSRRTTSRGFSSLADSLNSSLAETDPDLLAIINDEKQRQKESINLIGKKHILCFCIVVFFLLVNESPKQKCKKSHSHFRIQFPFCNFVYC